MAQEYQITQHPSGPKGSLDALHVFERHGIAFKHQMRNCIKPIALVWTAHYIPASHRLDTLQHTNVHYNPFYEYIYYMHYNALWVFISKL